MKLSYTWSDECFPYLLYYSSPKLRIHIIENITHNFNWLSLHRHLICDKDVFLVALGTYYHNWLVKEAKNVIEHLGLCPNNFYILFNDIRDKSIFERYGFRGELINQNCWLDESIFPDPLEQRQKTYDAIYVARNAPFKRHYLCENVTKLALVVGQDFNPNTKDILKDPLPQNDYINSAPLDSEDVFQKNTQSRCGLILSKQEGACFASSEYLLCGIPVVSTYASGGRMVWYNEENSVIVKDDPKSVKDGVDFILKESWRFKPQQIIEDHIRLSTYFRNNFIKITESIFSLYKENVDARLLFKEKFFHKWYNNSHLGTTLNLKFILDS